MCSDQVPDENYFDEKESSVNGNSKDKLQVSIKGRLKNHADYWEKNLGANSVVTCVIKEVYKIRFTYTPKKLAFKTTNQLYETVTF